MDSRTLMFEYFLLLILENWKNIILECPIPKQAIFRMPKVDQAVAQESRIILEVVLDLKVDLSQDLGLDLHPDQGLDLDPGPDPDQDLDHDQDLEHQVADLGTLIILN